MGIKYNLFSKINNVGVLIKEGKISPEIIESFNEYGLFEKYSLTKDEQNETLESNEEIDRRCICISLSNCLLHSCFYINDFIIIFEFITDSKKE